jgi:hypothetical protein
MYLRKQQGAQKVFTTIPGARRSQKNSLRYCACVPGYVCVRYFIVSESGGWREEGGYTGEAAQASFRKLTMRCYKVIARGDGQGDACKWL